MSGSQPNLPVLVDGRLSLSDLRRYAREWNEISHDGTAGGEQYNAVDFVDWLALNLEREGRRPKANARGISHLTRRDLALAI